MLFSIRPATVLAVVSALLITHVKAIPKITRTGKYLYQEDGTRFFIRGIAYQEQGEVTDTSANNDFEEPTTFIDPLALGDACTRDVQYLKQAAINTIRVYSVNSSLNHDSCMKTFSDNNIYTIIDLALPANGSIERVNPSWSTNLLEQYQRTIDVFAKYDNVLAYNVGNEVIRGDSTANSPYIKAAARDIKAYLKSKNLNVLVGYASLDGDASWRDALRSYLTCGSEETSIDIYGLNTYRWCGAATFESAYQTLTQQFADYNVVAYLSETGCIDPKPRTWTEADAIFSTQMSDVWSGAIAFSYFPARSAGGDGFGMVTISADGRTVTTSTDWDNLVTRYTGVTFPTTPAQGSAAASTYGTCAAATTAFTASLTLPGTPNEAACSCLDNALSCSFTPPTIDYRLTAGELIGTACTLLSQAGGSCNDIGGSGATGVYGRVAGCDITVKLSYVMSQYYESVTPRAATSCSFGGNGTVNSRASGTAPAAAQSCIASPNAVSVPSAPPALTGGPRGSNGGSGGNSGGNGGNGNSGNTGGSNNGNGNSGALSTGANGLTGIFAMAVVGIVGGIWTLA